MSNFNFTLVLYDYIPELVFTLRILGADNEQIWIIYGYLVNNQRMKFMNIILLQCNLSELNPELTEILCKQNFKCSPKI